MKNLILHLVIITYQLCSILLTVRDPRTGRPRLVDHWRSLSIPDLSYSNGSAPVLALRDDTLVNEGSRFQTSGGLRLQDLYPWFILL